MTVWEGNPIKACEERDRLRLEHSVLIQKYREALTILQSNPGSLAGRDYRGAQDAANAAQRRADELRIVYERHIASHHCDE